MESTLKPGEGKLDLFGFLRGDDSGGQAGIGVDYQHRLNSWLSAFAEGQLWKSWGVSVNRQFEYEAKLGARVRF